MYSFSSVWLHFLLSAITFILNRFNFKNVFFNMCFIQFYFVKYCYVLQLSRFDKINIIIQLIYPHLIFVIYIGKLQYIYIYMLVNCFFIIPLGFEKFLFSVAFARCQSLLLQRIGFPIWSHKMRSYWKTYPLKKRCADIMLNRQNVAGNWKFFSRLDISMDNIFYFP